MYIGFPGDLFLRALKLLILPLIGTNVFEKLIYGHMFQFQNLCFVFVSVSSLVNSLARLNARTAGRLGYLCGLYFLLTTLLAVVEGIILVLAIKPGKFGTLANKGNISQDCHVSLL